MGRREIKFGVGWASGSSDGGGVKRAGLQPVWPWVWRCRLMGVPLGSLCFLRRCSAFIYTPVSSKKETRCVHATSDERGKKEEGQKRDSRSWVGSWGGNWDYRGNLWLTEGENYDSRKGRTMIYGRGELWLMRGGTISKKGEYKGNTFDYKWKSEWVIEGEMLGRGLHYLNILFKFSVAS